MMLIFLWTALVFSMAAVMPQDKDSYAAEKWLKRINISGAEDRQESIEWLGILKEKKAVPSLIKALSDKHPGVQTEAVRALGMIGDSRAIVPLLQFIAKDYDYGESTVVSALQKIDPLWNARPEVTKLYDQLKNELNKNHKNEENICRLLILIDGRSSIPLCLKILREWYDERSLYQAIKILTKYHVEVPRDQLMAKPFILDSDYLKFWISYLEELGLDWRNSIQAKKIMRKIIWKLEKGDKRVKHETLNILDNVPFPEAVPVIKKIIGKETDTYLRGEAIRVLGAIDTEEAFEALIEGLNNPNKDIKTDCLRALQNVCKAPCKRAVPKELIRMLTQPENKDILIYAIQTAGYWPDDKILAALTHLLWSSIEDRDIVVKALANLKDKRAVPVLLGALARFPDAKERFDIIQALMDFEDPSMIEPFMELLKTLSQQKNQVDKNNYYDPLSDYVTNALIGIMETLGRFRERRALPILKETLRHPDYRVRAYAEWAIYQILN